MNGFIVKAITVMFAAISFFPLVIFANSATKQQIKIYQQKQGCMTCHQADAMQSDGFDDSEES